MKAPNWKREVLLHQGSGISGAEYCRRQGLPLKSFHCYRKKYRQEPERNVLLRARIIDDTENTSVQIYFRDCKIEVPGRLVPGMSPSLSRVWRVPDDEAPLFVSQSPADFRKSYDGLSGLVINSLGRNPTDGSLYAFFDRSRTQVKVLYYRTGGTCLWQMRLDAGTFAELRESGGYVLLSRTQF